MGRLTLGGEHSGTVIDDEDEDYVIFIIN